MCSIRTMHIATYQISWKVPLIFVTDLFNQICWFLEENKLVEESDRKVSLRLRNL